MKDNKKVIVASIVLLIAIIGIVLIFTKNKSVLSDYVTNTEVETTKGYKLDLRIFGKHNDTKINKIIIVTNHENKDKNITITDLSSSGEKEVNYVVKGKDYYEVKEEKLEEIKEVKYEDTEVYLEGVNKAKDLKETESETIADTKYKVYKGTVDNSVIEKIVSKTDLGIKFNKDAEIEVWLTPENKIYKVYYRVENMTIYASYFGFGNTSEINLDMFKEKTEKA